MAKNSVYPSLEGIRVTVTHPATPASGDPVRLGEVIGVALGDERSDGTTVCDFSAGVWDLPVEGVDGSGNSAVAPGDLLYYTDADDPPINKKNTGRKVGFALGAVGSGQTGTIPVAVGGVGT